MVLGLRPQVEVHNEQGLVATGKVSIGSLWQVRLHVFGCSVSFVVCSDWMQIPPAASRPSGVGRAVRTWLLMLGVQATEQRNAPAAAKGKQGLWRSKPKEAVAGGAIPAVEVLDKDGRK